MAKSAAPVLPDPLPSEGGSYMLNESTGKWELLSRTEPAAPLSGEASTELPAAELPAELLSAEPPVEPEAEPPVTEL
jgi:hypothetical protein